MFYIIYFERVIRNRTFANDVTAKITTKNDITSIVCLVSGEELSVARHMFGASAILDPFIGELYDALVKSYNTDKDVFDTYGEVFSLKRSQDDKDKDQDPFAGFDRGTKRRKSSKDVESSRDPKSKESKSTISSKGAPALIISHL
ncbi:hypothetical protein Tco_0183873 [Tanacetum coccineum]